MIKRRGFTLTELMIAMAILAVLTALVLPMVNNNAPSRNRMMMKKAYYTIEDVVRELINNEQYYPELGSDGNTYAGFDNLLDTCTNSCGGLSKFAKLFANQLNLKDNASEINKGFSFETNDGIYWEIVGRNTPPTEVVNAGDSGVTQVITVDVNGSKKPNAMQGSSSYSAPAGNLRDIDRFRVYVTRHGKIIPASGQTWFENAIRIDSSVDGD